MTKRFGVILATLIGAGLLAHPATASAASITFVFDYYTYNPHVAPHTMIGPSGSWGTLTLTDSTTDENRVDVHLDITPPAAFAGATLEAFYFNFVSPFLNGFPAGEVNAKFRMVTQSTPITGPSNDPFTGAQLLGTMGYADGLFTYGLANLVFDLTSAPPPGGKDFLGSISMYNEAPATDVPVNLDVTMFNLLSGGSNSPLMLAAYRLNNYNVNPNTASFPVDGEFWAFASVRAVPEPATWLLVGIGLAGIAARRRRAARR